MNSTIQPTERKTSPAENKVAKPRKTSTTSNPARKVSYKKRAPSNTVSSGGSGMTKTVITLSNGAKVDGFKFNIRDIPMMSLQEIFENEARLKREREERNK